MRLRATKSAHSVSYSVIKSAYINKKRTTVTVEKLGNEKEICKKYGVSDALAWAKEYVANLNKNAERNKPIDISFDPSIPLTQNDQRLFNGGYLFLQDIYFQLGFDKICKAIARKHGFKYNLNSILSRLLYTRILYPSSKLSSFALSSRFIEKPDFSLEDIYRSLSIINEESDYIQSTLYRNSLKISKRKTGVIYYDCTNYFFELEQADGLKQYGASKENRPLPIVQMGLFMDSDGIPLAFSVNPGNTNEQTTMVPLEKKLVEDFSLSRLVVCTDAGLSALSNRKYNSKGNRGFITTQSIKKLKGFLKEWCLDSKDWRLKGSMQKYNISELDEEKDREKIFYKERWINENGLEQHLIVSYSIKYRDYLRYVRSGQISRAQNLITNNPKEIDHNRQTDFKRFVKKNSVTPEGELAEQSFLELNEDVIRKEEQYDGFYAVCTNLEDDASAIIEVNKQRWQIEECFRIMKSEFKARPVYLHRDDRIKAHFMICFLSLILYRYLDKQLGSKYSCEKLLHGLKDMNFLKIEGRGFIPTYAKTEFTDDLEKAFGINTSMQIVTIEKMRNICHQTKE